LKNGVPWRWLADASGLEGPAFVLLYHLDELKVARAMLRACSPQVVVNQRQELIERRLATGGPGLQQVSYRSARSGGHRVTVHAYEGENCTATGDAG
jgi:hypothetical protein